MSTSKIDKLVAKIEWLMSNHDSALDYEAALEDVRNFIESMQEDPKKKCMYSNDNYTNEDRQVLCDGCEELCKYNSKTVAESLGISQEEYDKIVDECIYGKEPELVDVDDLPNKEEEPVSEELEEAANNALNNVLNTHEIVNVRSCLEMFKFGAEWKGKQDKETIELAKESVSGDLEEYINELSKQFPEVSFAKLSRIAVRVSRWQQNQDVKNKLPKVTDRTELDEYAYQCAYNMSNDWAIDNPTWHDVEDACKLGANWQKEKEYTCYEEAFEDGAKWKVENLWKTADGDDLPEIDREVIALLDGGKVVFAHRPPEYWDGKDITTGKVTRNYPKTYDKGGWNIPDVKYWLDVELPKEIEL